MFRTFLILDTGSIHPEALNWAARVAANGGTVSDSTLRAVSDFCKETASIRSLFLRLNLFAGNNLNAALVPLYLGEAPGIVYGNTVDTNFNFVAADYTERGTNGGLIGNGVNKYLNTGFIPNSVAAYGLNDASMSIYVANNIAQNSNQIGCTDNTNFNNSAVRTVGNVAGFRINSSSSSPTFSNTNSIGFWLFTRNNNLNLISYLNNNVFNTYTNTSSIKLNLSIFVFGSNVNGLPGAYSSHRLFQYSMAKSFTASQVSLFYNALQKFQTALNRQV